MIHLVSYSYPPDNVPSAQRPSQVAASLELLNTDFRVYSRHGILKNTTSAAVNIRTAAASRKQRALLRFAKLNNPLKKIIDLDKAILWAIRIFLPAVFLIFRDRLVSKRKQTIWATGPSISNIYLGAVLAWLTRSDLHLDIRDVLSGMDSPRLPLLSKYALNKAKSITAVSWPIIDLLQRHLNGTIPILIYNGISPEVFAYAQGIERPQSEWLSICYTGALYDDERPCLPLLRLLSRAVTPSLEDTVGIKLNLITRETPNEKIKEFQTAHFIIDLASNVSRREAVQVAAFATANVVLVGNSSVHTSSIPLKCFDLLAAGRPILIISPKHAAALEFLRVHSPFNIFHIEAKFVDEVNINHFQKWLTEAHRASSHSLSTPSSRDSADAITNLLTADCKGPRPK